MGDKMQLQKTSSQGTVMIFSFLETSIYCFKIKVFGVLVHSDFSKKYLHLKKKEKKRKKVLLRTIFSDLQHFSKHLLFVDFHCQLQSALLVS